MSEMSFSEYSAEINGLLENEDFAAAISMARNLLRQYPKCVDGYRLLAQAVLGTKEYREAADLFRRVLSADPEDLAARIGLAAVYREEGILDEAIWQMLRAFELAPGNGEVRQQLRALFERRDGRAPGRLKLNSAALARVYMRDGWYERAVDELRVQIESEPDRVDLRVALAEALWRAGRRQEAVETSEEILVELPFCLKANLFLGQFYAETGDSDAAWDRLQIAQALDPENRVATDLFGEASYLPPQNVTVRLPHEEPTTEEFPTGDDEDLPQWLRSLSVEQDSESEQWPELSAGDWRDQLRAASEEALDQWQPDWRVELRRATAQALPLAEEQASIPSAADVAPEWAAELRAATAEALRAWESAQPATTTEAAEPEPAAPGEASGVVAEQLPEPATPSEPSDWREALARETLAALEEAERAIAEAADWRASLAAETDLEIERAIGLEETRPSIEATEAPGPSVEVETPLEGEEQASLTEPEPAVPEIADWRASLAAETHALLDVAEQPAGEAEPSDWRETLLDVTRAEVGAAEHLAEEATPTDWRDALADVTREALEGVPPAPQEAPAPDEDLESATPLPVQAEATPISTEPEVETPSFVASGEMAEVEILPSETGVADEARTGIEDKEISAGEAESEGAERPTEPDAAAVVGEVQPSPTAPPAAPVQLEPPEPGWTELPAAVHVPAPEPAADERPEAGEPAGAAEDELEAAEVPQPADLLSSSDLVRSAERKPPSLEDRLLLADRLRAAGEAEAALTHYQAIADGSDLLDEPLIERLLAWTKEDDVGPRVHQLLGDIYRRRNRLREAVDQYRAAISKM